MDLFTLVLARHLRNIYIFNTPTYFNYWHFKKQLIKPQQEIAIILSQGQNFRVPEEGRWSIRARPPL